MNVDFSQIVTQIIAFLVMLWVLKKFGWKPLLSLLNERRQYIQSEFDAVAAQKQAVGKLIEEYEEKLKEIDTQARHKIQEAIMQGRKMATEIQDEAQASAKEIIVKAKNEINREMASAKAQLRDDLVNLVIITTEKILQQELDEPSHKKLIADFVQEADLK